MMKILALFAFTFCSFFGSLSANDFPLESGGLFEGEIEAFLDENLALENQNDSKANVQLTTRPLPAPAPPMERNESTLIAQDLRSNIESPLAAGLGMDQITQPLSKEISRSIGGIEINFKEVFVAAPLIYTLLLILSTASVCIWLYSMLMIRSKEMLPPSLIGEIREKLVQPNFDQALDLCARKDHFFCKMLASGILARKHGLSAMVDTMKAEGKRSTMNFWQRLHILNEIAVIAPMIGLLGTVLGMFYAFYDLNRSMESVSLLFDGLGISVGTTVAGLFVAILAMVLYSIAKYRLVKVMASVENQVQTFAALIDHQADN